MYSAIDTAPPPPYFFRTLYVKLAMAYALFRAQIIEIFCESLCAQYQDDQPTRIYICPNA